MDPNEWNGTQEERVAALIEVVERLEADFASFSAYLDARDMRAEWGYLTADAAARYLGVKRKRIYDLKSMRVLVPDGFDGRTPLFTRETLDAYVKGTR